MTMDQILGYLLTTTGASATASFILDLIPAFRNWQDAESKRWIFFGVTLAISLGAFAVMTYVPKEVLEQLQPWIVLVVGVFSAQFLGTSYHKMVK